jgi:hypothetical protein
MKKLELKQIIKEEIEKVLKEASSIPSTYDFNNPGDEWKNIITKTMERFNKFPKNPKVKKDTINLFTAIYKLGFKKIGQKKQMISAEALANTLIGAGRRNNDVMQKSVDDVIAYIKNDIDPTAIPNWADYNAQKEFKAGKWTRITPQTKLKVGDEIVRMNDLLFADIVKIEGDKILLHFAMDYMDDKPTKKTRDVLEDYYLLMKN